MNRQFKNVNELRNYLYSNEMKNKNTKLTHITPRCLTYHSNNGLAFSIIKYAGLSSDNVHLFRIKFFNTGYEYNVSFGKIIRGNVDDPTDSSRSKYGVTLGSNVKILKHNDIELYHALKERWWAMIHRCYEPSSNMYYRYGGIGITVSDSWLCFENYYNDVTRMSTFNRDKVLSNELQLDKDYLQKDIPESKKVYSKETCLWLSPKSNHLNIDQLRIDRSRYDTTKAVEAHSRKFIVEFPDGHEEVHKNLMKFCRENDLLDANAGKCLRGERTHTKGFKFRSISDEEYDNYKNNKLTLKEKTVIDKKDLILSIEEYKKDSSLVKYIKLVDYYKDVDQTIARRVNHFIVTFPDKHEEIGKNIIGFCELHNIDESSAIKCMNGKARQAKGFKFRRITNEEYDEYVKLINEKGSTTILK